MDKMNLDFPELSIIIPCFNEGGYLPSACEDLASVLDCVVGKDRWQIVFVPNGCTDDTELVIETISQKWPSTLAVSLEKSNYGKALREGLLNAEGKWALIINVDFWDADFISWAWGQRKNYDLIIGSKRADPNLDKRPKYRRVLSWGLNVLLQIYFGLVATDTHGQKLLNLHTLRPILESCVMYRGQYDTEFTLRIQRKGLRLAEVPVPITELRKQRNLMIKKIIQNFVDIFRLKQVMKHIPQDSKGIRYHRYSRADMEMVRDNSTELDNELFDNRRMRIH